jgi:hypothetical protein
MSGHPEPCMSARFRRDRRDVDIFHIVRNPRHRPFTLIKKSSQYRILSRDRVRLWRKCNWLQIHPKTGLTISSTMTMASKTILRAVVIAEPKIWPRLASNWPMIHTFYWKELPSFWKFTKLLSSVFYITISCSEKLISNRFLIILIIIKTMRLFTHQEISWHSSNESQDFSLHNSMQGTRCKFIVTIWNFPYAHIWTLKANSCAIIDHGEENNDLCLFLTFWKW